MFLLLSDDNEIMSISAICVKRTDGWKISDHVILSDLSLTPVEVSEVPSGVIPHAYKYIDGTFVSNTNQSNDRVGASKYQSELKVILNEFGDLKETLVGKDVSEMNFEEYKTYRRKENNNILATYLENNPMKWIDGKSYGV